MERAWVWVQDELEERVKVWGESRERAMVKGEREEEQRRRALGGGRTEKRVERGNGG